MPVIYGQEFPSVWGVSYLLFWQWADAAPFTWWKLAKSLSGNRLSLGHGVTLRKPRVLPSLTCPAIRKHQIWERAWDGGRQAIYILQSEAS